jgi:hypothetical protein
VDGLHEILTREGQLVTLDVDDDGGLPVLTRDVVLVSLTLTELA